MNEYTRVNRQKWLNLIAFSLFYNTVYIARFNLNSIINVVADEISFLPYQETMLYSSIFVSYAVGSFINGRLVDRYSIKNMILLASVISISANVFITSANSWYLVLILSLVNGYFQSIIWLAGIRMIGEWWSSGERGLGCGVANFFSGLSHVTAYLLPAFIAILYPQLGWKLHFIAPLGVMTAFLGLFQLLSVEKADHISLDSSVESPAVEKEKSRLYFLNSSKFYWWCAIAMLSSLCRYGLLKWIPLYYNEQYGGNILSANFSNLILPMGMAFGTLILTWIAGKKFSNNKGIVIIISAALCGTLVVVFPIMPNTQTILAGIFCTGFFLYGINGILWLHALDKGGRFFSGTAAGILNCFAYLGAAAEAMVFPFIVKMTGSMIAIFIAMEVLCIAMVICGIIISDKDTIIEVEGE